MTQGSPHGPSADKQSGSAGPPDDLPMVLRASEVSDATSVDLLQILADNANMGLALTDVVAQKNLYVNRTYITHFGFDPDGPGPKLEDAFAMVRPEDAESTSSQLASGSLEPFSNEVLITRRDGTQCWILARYVPLPGEDGTVRFLATIGVDITERKAAEAALAAAHAEAERANAAKDEFLSRMSHELRTPLNAVLGFAQLLELDALSPPQTEAVDYILRGGRHLRTLINDLLDIASIESEHLEISAEPVHVGQLISDTIGLMRPLASASRITIDFDASSADRYVCADQRRLKQVLINLVSNAIKYNRLDGRIDITVELADETQLKLNVTDTGIGIPAEDLPRLFSPFDRLGQQTTDIEGTGIGLALSQRLITLMGGRLNVHSDPGQGSTFTIVVPSSKAPHAVMGSNSPTDAVSTEAIRPGNLLYIEDNTANVELLRGILVRRPEWTMTHAATGKLGLELAATSKPTVILLDLHLPDADGIEVLRTLKASPETSGIPVVILSADASPRQISRGLNVGAQSYFIKPINVGDILATLDPHTRTKPYSPNETGKQDVRAF